MLDRNEFNRRNRYIQTHNYNQENKRKALLIWSIIILLVGAISLAWNITIAFLIILSGSLLLFLRSRVGYENEYTIEQYAHDRAEQKLYLDSILHQKRQELYSDRDGRYISDDLRNAVLTRDNHRCRECGALSYLELDHIIPLSKGGATSYNNLQVLCRACNAKKGNR